jgi:hypothetical protein
MLRLPTPNKTFKGSEVDAFLKAHDGGVDLLNNFLTEPLNDSGSSSQIEVCSLKYPYKEFAWLFSRIVGQDSTVVVQNMSCMFYITLSMKMPFLIGHMLFQMKSLFNWEISTKQRSFI